MNEATKIVAEMMGEARNSGEKEAKELAERTMKRIEEMRDVAFKAGWARGYEKGFIAGVEAAGNVKPRIELA